MAPFRRLELANGVVLKLTAKHFIYKSANCSTSAVLLSSDDQPKVFEQGPVFAESVGVGDCVLYLVGEDKVGSPYNPW